MCESEESADGPKLVLARALLADLESLANVHYLLEKKLADRDDVTHLLNLGGKSLDSMIALVSRFVDDADPILPGEGPGGHERR